MASYPPMSPTLRSSALLALLFVVLGFVIYGPSLANGFVTLDDLQLIYFNPAAHGLSFEHIKQAFTTFDPELYVPFTLLSYQIEYSLFGLNPHAIHAVNLLLHISSSLLVAWVIALLTKKQWQGIICGLLFLLHPLNTEAVAWASARKDVLSSLFFFASLGMFLWGRERNLRSAFTLSVILFLCGLLSKVSILMLPVLLLCIRSSELELAASGIKETSRMKHILKILFSLLPFFLLSVIFGIIALFGKKDIIEGLSPLSTLLLGLKSTVFYLQKFFIPTGLSVMYPQITPVGLNGEFIIPIGIVAILLVLSYWLLKRERLIAFGILFFLLSVIPSFLNLSKAGDLYFASDRYAYIPMFGLLLALTSFALTWRERAFTYQGRGTREWALGGLLLIAIPTLGLLSRVQAMHWSDGTALFENTVRLYPETRAAHFNLGVTNMEAGNDVIAIDYFRKSLALRPTANATSGLGTIYLRQGNIAEAKASYEQGRALDPLDPEPWFGLGNLYYETEEMEKAIEAFEEALRLDPLYVAVYNNYAILLVEQGKFTEAETLYREALRINPDFPKTHFNLGRLLREERKLPDALKEYEIYLASAPDNTDALTEIAAIHLINGNYREALNFLKKALAIDPEYIPAKALLDEMVKKGVVGPK